MAERLYLLLFGIAVLAGLYFESQQLLYALVAISLLEGVINRRLLKGIAAVSQISLDEGVSRPAQSVQRIGFDATRAWRLLVGSVLLISVIFHEQLWFFPWFLGFAVTGAGLSGVCPVLWVLYYLGFR